MLYALGILNDAGRRVRKIEFPQLQVEYDEGGEEYANECLVLGYWGNMHIGVSDKFLCPL